MIRTTLAIDDDVLAAAKHLAERDGKSLGEIVSALARQGLSRATRSTRSGRNGVLLMPRRGGLAPVTPELVNQMHDELP